MNAPPSGDLGKLRSMRADGRCRRLLRLKDAAYYLSISPKKLRNLIERGEIPAIRPGGNAPWLVDVGDCDAWIDRQKQACKMRNGAHTMVP